MSERFLQFEVTVKTLKTTENVSAKQRHRLDQLR